MVGTPILDYIGLRFEVIICNHGAFVTHKVGGQLGLAHEGYDTVIAHTYTK
jgi:hypothetical protein